MPFQLLASTSQDISHTRQPRHALASSQNYKDKFGFVSNGIDEDDHTLAFHVGRSYTAQNRQKKQVARGAAPHARNVSNSYRFVILLVIFLFHVMFNISCKIWYLTFFQYEQNEEPSNPIKMLAVIF